jgi:hypothetical protein
MNFILDCALGYLLITATLAILGWAWTKATCRVVLRDWRIARRDIWPGCKVELLGTPLCANVAGIYSHPDKPTLVLVDEIWNGDQGDSEDCPLATVLPASDVARMTRESLPHAARRIRAQRRAAS